MPGIVVGVDGSEGSKHALDWAIAEARLRQIPLRLVRTWQLPPSSYDGLGFTGVGKELLDDMRAGAEEGLDAICTEFSAKLEGLTVERTVVEGPAAPALIEAAADADLLVVGTRGHGGFAGLLLGSVSQQCAHHSPCPVVIIPAARRKQPADQ